MLTEELMHRVRELEIATRRSVSEVFAGEYSSAFRGRGMEFHEVREYQPGDDIRTIDWNVTARQGSPYVKRYVEERELTVILAVDVSASGRFGSVRRTKAEAAAELSGVVALAATRKNDKVGLLMFTDRVEAYVPPAKGLKHVLRIIRDLLEFTPAAGRGTDISAAAEYLGRVLRRRSVIFFVSDFLVHDGAWTNGLETSLRVLNRRHDVVSARVEDPRERAMPERGAGLIEVIDAETGRRLTVDTSSARARREFESMMKRRREAVRGRLHRLGIDGIDVSPSEPYVHALIELFRRRGKRR